MLVSGCARPLVPFRIEIEPLSKIWPSTTHATHLVTVAGRVSSDIAFKKHQMHAKHRPSKIYLLQSRTFTIH